MRTGLSPALSCSVPGAWSHRELVAELNQRARDHRLEGAPRPADEVALSDGNHASVGDTVITRRNDRRLQTAPTDWVKNGDRWTVLDTDDAATTATPRDRPTDCRDPRASGKTSP